VDFELSEVEVALGESIRAMCASRYPIEELLHLAGEQFAGKVAPFDHGGWASLGEAGVFALQVPSDAGGVGLGMGASSVVFEELGRAIVPGPLVSTHLAARDLPQVVQGSDSGKRLVGSIDLSKITPARPVPFPFVLPFLDVLDWLVIVEEEHLSVVEPSKLEAPRAIQRPLDPLTPLWAVESLPAGQTVAEAGAAARWRRDTNILTSAILVGIAAKCVEMAVSYAKEREQFGRPVGSFQAVKHLCADMIVRAETARVAVQAAAVTVDEPAVGDVERAACGASLIASEAALRNAKSCIQVHGGMGFTWEVPAHLYLMRSRMLAEALTPRGALAEIVAERY